MLYTDCIKNQPWLKIYNHNNITDRMQRATKGNAFLCWNNFTQSIELHTVEAYHLSGDSYNTGLEPSYICHFLIDDYAIANFALNGYEIQEQRRVRETQRRQWEEERRRASQAHGMRTLEGLIGTKL